MALALYRKYRPATFAEVVGQEHVTEPLRTALSAGRVSHAYLFSGPRGCGKTSSARILARSLNCVNGPTPDPCGECPSCIALAPEGPGNIDVIELDAASHGGVDDARELRDRAFYAPAESRYRVFIVDEAHMVTTQGFNALLKIVEEPPEHLVFVFATTEPDKVLTTIRSRTHHYPFRLIPPGTLRTLLERICADEGAIVAPPVYPLVIRAGGGSARDTLSVLDQLLAGAGPEGVTYDRAVALLGVTDVALIDDVVDALAALDGAAVFSTVDRLVEAGHDPRRFAADLLDRLRDLILLDAVPDAPARGLVDAPADELSRMADQAGRLGPATLSRFAEIVHTGLTEMRGATAPRLLLELLCGRMLLPAASTSDNALLQRLERMERRADIVADSSSDGAGQQGRTFQRPSQSGHPGASDDAAGRSAEHPGTAGSSAETSGAAGPPGAGGRSAEDPGATEAEYAGAARRSAERREAAEHSAAPASSAETAAAARPAEPSGAARTAEPSGAARTAEPSGAARSAGTSGDAAHSAETSGAAARSAETSAAARSAGTSAAARSAGTSAAARSAGTSAAAARSAEYPDAGGSAPRSAERDAPGERSAPPAEPAEPAPSTSSHGIDAAAVRRVWPGILDRAKQASRSTGALLMNATVRAVENDTLVLTIAAAPLARRLSEQRNTDVIATALRDELGVAWRVRCEHDGGGQTRAPSAGNGGSGAEPPAPPTRSAPRQSGEAHRAPTRNARPARPNDPPLPPEPPPDDEDEMIAEAAAYSADRDGAEPVSRRDPEEVAIELLASQLGARAVDEPRR